MKRFGFPALESTIISKSINNHVAFHDHDFPFFDQPLQRTHHLFALCIHT